jgi:lipid II:glycine glycyltransferase (peptidoglycan interpeptide bridge formation enzyme)
MRIRDARPDERAEWNEFVVRHFGPVGAFFQSWEWGEFQRSLGMRTLHLVLEGNQGERLGLTLALHRRLPPGFEYVYLPRGPVFPQELWSDEPRLRNALAALREELTRRYPNIAFIRMEPAIPTAPPVFAEPPFQAPAYYIQPRFNTVVDLAPTEEAILMRLSAPMRNNVRKAVRKGVSVELKTALTEEEWRAFAHMRQDTARRAGKGIFPDERYFRNLTAILPPIGTQKADAVRPHSGIFVATHGGELAAINIVIFFADSATFLFGAAFSRELPFKVSPYLHWSSLIEAKKRGFRHYDLGGVDAKRWKTLTYFKEQFGGRRVEYMGNVDVVEKPLFYAAYRVLRGLRR